MNKKTALDNFINGQWARNDNARRFVKIDPTSGEELVEVTESTDDDVEKAIESAADFHRSGASSDIGIDRMDEIFGGINVLLWRYRDELADTLTRETGKSHQYARDEIEKTIETFKAIQYQKHHATGETLPSQDNAALVFTERYPVGVAAVITPWNFPVYIGAQHLAPALMGRNTVIQKCSPHAPASSSRLVEILLEAGIPPRMLTLIHGSRPEVAETLVADRRVDMVSFTGSSETARKIAEKRGGRRLVLEGGGNNFQVVLGDSDIASAARSAAKGAMAFSGQKCVATGNVLVEETVLDEFVAEAKEIVERMKTGDARNGADIGPLVGEKYDALKEMIGNGLAHGGRLITGGRRVYPESLSGSFFAPTIMVLAKDNPLVRKELFAPVLKIVPIKDLDEAVDIINQQEYGLAASIFSRRHRDIIRFIHQVRAGLVNVNSATGGSEAHVPFGGGGLSGNGFRLGNPQEALRAFTEVKTVKWYSD